MTTLKLQPVDYVQVRYKDGYYDQQRSMIMTPYRSPTVMDTASALGIRVPFNTIVTADQGTSKCQTCNAVYAGTQPVCDREVRQVKLGWRWITSETMLLGQYCHSDVVTETRTGLCDGSLRWSLQKEFEYQQSFFNMLESLSNLAPYNPLNEFKDCFLPGVKEHLETLQLQQQVRELSIELSRHQQAIKIMVDKMNSAGLALTF